VFVVPDTINLLLFTMNGASLAWINYVKSKYRYDGAFF